jgi:hypothetical protein
LNARNEREAFDATTEFPHWWQIAGLIAAGPAVNPLSESGDAHAGHM